MTVNVLINMANDWSAYLSLTDQSCPCLTLHDHESSREETYRDEGVREPITDEEQLSVSSGGGALTRRPMGGVGRTNIFSK